MKQEKDIVTLKYTEKISFADARKRPPWARKIRHPIDFKTEVECLKYILNYCLTRLDILDEIGGSLVGEISLTAGLPVSQQIQLRGLRVLLKVAKIVEQ